MTAVAFNTLRFVRTLREKAKMSSEQAEGLADAVAEAIQNDLATKTDIALVRADIEALRLSTKADITAVRTNVEALRLSTRTGIEALRLSTKADLREAELRLEARIEGTKVEIIEWVIGSIGFQALVIVGAVAALTRGLH